MDIKARIGDNPNLIEVDFSQLRWNKKAQRYISPRGKFINPKAVRKVIDTDIDSTAVRMRGIGAKVTQAARDLQEGKITRKQYQQAVTQFSADMRREVKNMHLANTMAAKGGIASMNAKAYQEAGRQLKFHYDKLFYFANELRDNPDIALNQASGRMNFEDRLDLYTETGRFTYEKVRQQSHIDQGYKYVENILEQTAHHCSSKKSTEGCLEQTAKGRVPIAQMVLIGKRTCGPKDRCHLKYFKYQKRRG